MWGHRNDKNRQESLTSGSAIASSPGRKGVVLGPALNVLHCGDGRWPHIFHGALDPEIMTQFCLRPTREGLLLSVFYGRGTEIGEVCSRSHG